LASFAVKVVRKRNANGAEKSPEKRVGPDLDDKRAKAPIQIPKKPIKNRKKLQKSANPRLPSLTFGASGRRVPGQAPGAAKRKKTPEKRTGDEGIHI
jgi:hypothetical protein